LSFCQCVSPRKIQILGQLLNKLLKNEGVYPLHLFYFHLILQTPLQSQKHYK
jgi:hypothetical protein